ncbi:MAG: hypothetical protein ABIR53_06680, partial [Paraperlucidibaca sp.]
DRFRYITRHGVLAEVIAGIDAAVDQGYPDSRIGFISPHSNTFCASCNRLRLTAEGRLLLCLGQEQSLSLRDLIRQHPSDDSEVHRALHAALTHKPASHDFQHDGEQLVRFMSATGG